MELGERAGGREGALGGGRLVWRGGEVWLVMIGACLGGLAAVEEAASELGHFLVVELACK